MIKEFFSGIQAYFQAFGLLFKLRLWKFVFIPGLISIFLGGAIGTSAWLLAGQLGSWLLSWYPFAWGLDFMSGFSAWVGGILIVVFGLIIYKHLVMIIVAPFMAPLSERVERHLMGGGSNYKGFSWAQAGKDFARGLYINLRNLIRELLFVAPLLILSIIPGVGLIPIILIFIIQAYYAGFGNMDYTLERHFTTKGTIQFVKSHRGLAIGNGTVFMLLLMTGFGFLVAPPLATIAATIQTVKKLDRMGELADEDYV